MTTEELWNTLDAIQNQTKFFEEIYLDSEDEMLYYDLCGSKTRHWLTREQKTCLECIILRMSEHLKNTHGDEKVTVYDFIDV